MPDVDEEPAFLPGTALRQPADALGPRAQRTIARIVEATRDVFLIRGYAGTTIDEIARVADVSRASFYTYFPSKREVLLAVGAQSAGESLTLIERLPADGTTRDRLTGWVGDYFELLDVHGAFAFAWTQAAAEDEEIRSAGMKRHLSLCRELGTRLAASAGRTTSDPTTVGLVASSLLERTWSYDRLYADAVSRPELVAQVAETLWAMARRPT